MWGAALEIIPVVFVLQTCWTHAEVFTSVARVMALASLEDNVIDHLERIISVSRQNGESCNLFDDMQRRLSCMKHRNSILKTSPKMLENPVVGFTFLRRLVREWNLVNRTVSKHQSSNCRSLVDNIISMIDVLSKWQNWPRMSDVTGAALGLLTIGQVYDLFPSPAWLTESLTSTACSTKKIQSKCTMVTHDHFLSMFEKRLFKNSMLGVSIEQKALNIADETCEYDYWTLSSEDYLFNTRVALNHEMYTEAKRWFVLGESLVEMNGRPNNRILAQVETIKKLLTTSTKTSILLDQRGPEDRIQAAYVRLCRDFIQSNQQRFVSSRHSLHCYWSITSGYLRHKAEIIHQSPLVVRFYDVISQTEIDHVIDEAWSRLTPSELHQNHRTSNRTHLLRVSQTAWLPDNTDILGRLSARVGQVTQLDTRQLPLDTPAEPFQIVNYGLGGLYVPHEDSVRRAREMGQEDTPSLRGSGDRMVTWMFYLSDVEAGGATVFPLLNVHVRPIKGSAILWYNLKRNGEVDKKLVHAACPVLTGNKWVANKWLRETSQVFHRRCSTRPED